MRQHAAGVSRLLVEAEAHHKLVFGAHLQVVAWFQLIVLNVIILHAYESRIDIGLGIAVAPA